VECYMHDNVDKSVNIYHDNIYYCYMKDTMIQENLEDTSDISSTEKRIQNIFRSRVKRNFSNIKPLISVHDEEYNKNGEPEKTPEPDIVGNLEGFTSGSNKGNFFSKSAKKVQKAIPIQGKDFTSLQGWKRIFQSIFSIYPGVVNRFTDEFVDTVASNTNTNVSRQKYKEDKKDDKRTLSHSAYEFIYIFIALYMTYMIFSRVYSSTKLSSITELFETGNSTLDDVIPTMLLYVFAPCEMFYYMFTEGFRTLFSWMGLESTPTLRFTCLFMMCYFLVYFFLDEIGKMFLNVFDYRASSSMYMFIVFAWLFYLFVSFSQKNFWAMALNYLWVIATIILLALSMAIAPIAQLLFVIYVLYACIGSLQDIKQFLFRLIGGRDNDSFVYNTEEILKNSMFSNQTELRGGFDHIMYKYGIKYILFFLMLLFFLFKTIQGFTDFKISTVGGLVTIFNITVTVVLFIIYVAMTYFNNRVPRTEDISVNKTPSAPPSAPPLVPVPPSAPPLEQAPPLVQVPPETSSSNPIFMRDDWVKLVPSTDQLPTAPPLVPPETSSINQIFMRDGWSKLLPSTVQLPAAPPLVPDLKKRL
jgi:hypothetical protein